MTKKILHHNCYDCPSSPSPAAIAVTVGSISVIGLCFNLTDWPPCLVPHHHFGFNFSSHSWWQRMNPTIIFVSSSHLNLTHWRPFLVPHDFMCSFVLKRVDFVQSRSYLFLIIGGGVTKKGSIKLKCCGLYIYDLFLFFKIFMLY